MLTDANQRQVSALVALILWSSALPAMTIREYRRFPAEKQAVFISAAVSMAAYTSASNGDTATASCIKRWFFGRNGEEGLGPRKIALEIAVAERRDPDHYQVEGVILGTLQEACPSTK